MYRLDRAALLKRVFDVDVLRGALQAWEQRVPGSTLLRPFVWLLTFSALDAITAQVVAFKKKLLDIIDPHGGVSEVARKSGIPQLSLSRMLNSASMPRRTTLYRIARALDSYCRWPVPESAVVTDWIR